MGQTFVLVHDKLAEVLFFLSHLQQEQEKTTLQRQQDAVRFYLSAFLNAGFSVREYLEREATAWLRESARTKQQSGKQAKAKYPTWIADWKSRRSKEESVIWDLMTEHRRSEVHTSRVETTRESKAVPADHFSRHADPYYAYPPYGRAPAFYAAIAAGDEFNDPFVEEKHKLGLPVWCNAWTYSEIHHINVNGKQVTVVEACQKYHQLLSALVQDFETIEWDRSQQH